MPLIAALDARLVTRPSTGDTSYWQGLIRGMAGQTKDIELLLYSNAPRPDFIPEEFEWIKLSSRSDRWWSLVDFPLAARKRGAQVSHVQYSLSPLARGGITTIHDVSFFVQPAWFKPRDRLLLRLTVPAACRRAKTILTVSETSRRDIERYIPASKGKIIVTPNALGQNIQPLTDAEVEEELRAMRVPRPFILTVGTRWPRKNMDLAVAAADSLPESMPHQLVVTGHAGWGSAELGKRGWASGYVSNRQLTALYRRADAYLAPSHYEGFGIPLLEAFACGCPVLSSTGGALPEVAGNAALVEGDPARWPAALERILTDLPLRETLIERGRARVLEFEWRETARLTLQAYRSVAG